MQNLRLDPEEFGKERSVVIEERRQRVADDPTSRMHERFNAIAYLGTPYAQPVIGWQTDLDAMTIQDLERWYERYYAPNNATLVVAGDVDPANVVALAREHFGDMPASEVPEPPGGTGLSEAGERRIRVTDERADVPQLVMGYEVPSAGTADELSDSYALMMLSAILDGGDGARLSQDLVRDQGIAAQVGAGYNALGRLDTQLTLQAVPSPNASIGEVEAALREQIARLKREPVSAATLERARNQMLADHLFRLDSVFYQAMEIGRLETTGIGWEVLKDYEAGLEAVEPADIQAAARAYLTEQSLTVGILAPGSNESDATGDEETDS
jgi:zinc protease